jgi:DNA-binding FadR family transcriptional regulator
MPPDRTPELPSQRVEAALRARINKGEWQSRERLPSVAQLATEYGVARSTVVAALRRIEADGLVTIVSNWGTFRTLSARRSGGARAWWLGALPSGCCPLPSCRMLSCCVEEV